MPNMALCQQSFNKFEIWPPPSLDMLHRHVLFAHFLLTNNGLCRPNCLCHQQWHLHLAHSVSIPGSFFRLAFLYLYLHLSLSLSFSLSLSLSLPPFPHFLPLYHYSIVWTFLCPTSAAFFVLWICECKDVWDQSCFTHKFGDHGTLSSFMRNRKDFPWLNLFMSKISRICVRSWILFAPNIILEIFAFEFDCVAILGFIIPWVPLRTQEHQFFTFRTRSCNDPWNIQCIEFFYPLDLQYVEFCHADFLRIFCTLELFLAQNY